MDSEPVLTEETLLKAFELLKETALKPCEHVFHPDANKRNGIYRCANMCGYYIKRTEFSMDLNEYQHRARQTAIYPVETAVNYPIHGANGEVAELVEHVLGLVVKTGGLSNIYKKTIRDNVMIDNDFVNLFAKELGDVLWYIANIADDLGISLGEIAVINVEKLESRKERGVLGGNGDNR